MSDTKIQLRRRHEAAHRRSVEYSVRDVAAVLEEHLGRRLVAHVAGVADPKAVGAWSAGTRTPHPEAEARLRTLLQIFVLLQSEENAHTARAWLIGMNPQLNDEAPADALREDRVKDVLAAARSYAAGG